jgi:hypothetical protein
MAAPGLGLLHQDQGGQHLADVIREARVAPGELLDRRTFPLPECFHEFVRNLAERVRGRRVVSGHHQIPSMPPGSPWNTSLRRLRART